MNEKFFEDCAAKAQAAFENENMLLKPFKKYIIFDMWLTFPIKDKIIFALKWLLKLITKRDQSW
jgi:hypothetical protein